MADVAERIADDLALAQAEQDELLPSGRQRLLHNRIHWAKFYMSKAGLIASPGRGLFRRGVRHLHGERKLLPHPHPLNTRSR
ncbi:winged helix-turn-helix domain-containing protein [Rhizobium ruizarguesonis]